MVVMGCKINFVITLLVGAMVCCKNLLAIDFVASCSQLQFLFLILALDIYLNDDTIVLLVGQ